MKTWSWARTLPLLVGWYFLWASGGGPVNVSGPYLSQGNCAAGRALIAKENKAPMVKTCTQKNLEKLTPKKRTVEFTKEK